RILADRNRVETHRYVTPEGKMVRRTLAAAPLVSARARLRKPGCSCGDVSAGTGSGEGIGHLGAGPAAEEGLGLGRDAPAQALVDAAGALVVGKRPDEAAPAALRRQLLPGRGEEARAEADALHHGIDIELVDLAALRQVEAARRSVDGIARELAAEIDDA